MSEDGENGPVSGLALGALEAPLGPASGAESEASQGPAADHSEEGEGKRPSQERPPLPGRVVSLHSQSCGRCGCICPPTPSDPPLQPPAGRPTTHSRESASDPTGEGLGPRRRSAPRRIPELAVTCASIKPASGFALQTWESHGSQTRGGGVCCPGTASKQMQRAKSKEGHRASRSPLHRHLSSTPAGPPPGSSPTPVVEEESFLKAAGLTQLLRIQ